MPELPPNHFEITPDWVCEILSSFTARIDRAKKLPIYAKYGVSHAWLVDADQQYLEVKRLAGSLWLDVATFEGDAQVRAEPFEAVEIDMTLVWS